MGVLLKRGKYWHIDLRINGKRIRKTVGTDKKLAELTLKDIEIKAARNEFGFLEKKEISPSAFFFQFKDYAQTNHRPSTVKRYRAVTDNFQTFLKQKNLALISLSQITADIIERYKIHRKTIPVSKNGSPIHLTNPKFIRTGAKAHTINFELGALRTAFYLAVKWGYLKSNPCIGVSLLKTDDSKRRRFLTKEECALLLKVAREPYYGIFFTFLNTGMRLSELNNLEWSDIDTNQRLIKIQKKSFWLPKTGERVIPINDGLWAYLQSLPRKSNFVFLGRRDEKLDNNRVRLELISTARKAEIQNLTQVHALRHTFASQLLMSGADLPSVQKLLGHSKIETTMIYTHQTEGHLRAAMSRLILF